MGVTKSAIARVTGCDVSFKNFNTGGANLLPQRLAVIAQGADNASYTLEPFEVTDAQTVLEKMGAGSLAYLVALQLFPKTGTQATFPVTFYPVAFEADAQKTKATGALTVSGSVATKNGSGSIIIGGVEISVVITEGETAADFAKAIAEEINKSVEMPVSAGTVEQKTPEGGGSYYNIPLSAKWSGKTGNGIKIVYDIETVGLSVAAVAFSGGAGVLKVDNALSLFGDVWETFILNTLGYDEKTLLNTYQTFGESRWSWQIQRPLLVAHGCTADYATRTAISDERKNDRINFFVQSTGSPELEAVVGARGLLDILTTADSDPAQNYKGLFSNLIAGNRTVQESYLTRNNAVNKGASTNVLVSSCAKLSDTVLFWHPENEGKIKSWRYVVDAVKLMNIIYNIRLINEQDEVQGAPLLPDSSVSSHPNAIRPKSFRTWYANMAESLENLALISDAKFTKENMVVEIDSENPKRVNSTIPVKLSGNVEIVSTDLFFGFYVGGAA